MNNKETTMKKLLITILLLLFVSLSCLFCWASPNRNMFFDFIQTSDVRRTEGIMDEARNIVTDEAVSAILEEY